MTKRPFAMGLTWDTTAQGFARRIAFSPSLGRGRCFSTTRTDRCWVSCNACHRTSLLSAQLLSCECAGDAICAVTETPTVRREGRGILRNTVSAWDPVHGWHD